jgi:hypothetical protein
MENSKDEKKTSVTARLSAGALDLTLSSESADVFVKDLPKVLEAMQKHADLVKGISEKLGVTGAAKVVPSKGATSVGELDELATLSPVEMLKKSDVKKDSEKVFLLTYYLFKVKRLETFTVADLRALINEARLEEPTNLNQRLNDLVTAGRLKEADEKDGRKAYTLSTTGEDDAKNLIWGAKDEN